MATMNALAAALGPQYSAYGGQQVDTSQSMLDILDNSRQSWNAMAGTNYSLQEYDKMMNPETYGARWGIPASTVNTMSAPTSPAPAVTDARTSETAPAYTPFESSAFSFEADPGYAFRKEQGDKALQAKQLASGNFFSGGALKEAADYNSGLASQEYGNAFQRYMSKDAADFRNHQANWNGNLTANNINYERGWNADMRDYNRWVDGYNRDREADNTNWSRLAYLDSSGQNAATQTANFGQAAANNIGANLNYGGSAQGDGYINSANAWTNALGNSIYALRR